MKVRYLFVCLRNLRSIFSSLVFSFGFTANIAIRRLLLCLTGRFVGPPIRSSVTGETIFNVHSLINAFAMQVVGELNGPWQRHIRECPTPVVFDVGCNIGQFGHLVRSLNPICRVYTWDAWSAMREYVPMEFHRSCALGKAEELATLNFTKLGWTASTIKGHYQEIGTVVKVLKLDAEWLRLGCLDIDVLKIDVDGAEFDVLAGAQETLKYTKFVIVETEDLAAVKKLCPNRRWTTRNNFDYCGELIE